MGITPIEVRKARAFLQGRDLQSGDIAPKDFAALAAKLDKSFAETLKYLATIQMGGQGRSQSANTEDVLAQEKE